jgi:hypothetical protein
MPKFRLKFEIEVDHVASDQDLAMADAKSMFLARHFGEDGYDVHEVDHLSSKVTAERLPYGFSSVVPEAMRATFDKFDIGLSRDFGLQRDVIDGEAWATDAHVLILLERSLVEANTSRAKQIREMLRPAPISTTAVLLREALKIDGHDRLVFNSTFVVDSRYVDLVETLYPGCTWEAPVYAQNGSPARASKDGALVALVRGIRSDEAELAKARAAAQAERGESAEKPNVDVTAFVGLEASPKASAPVAP